MGMVGASRWGSVGGKTSIPTQTPGSACPAAESLADQGVPEAVRGGSFYSGDPAQVV